MKVNRSVPPPTVVPVLVYQDVRAAVAFLKAAFGFEERTRIGDDHRAQMAVGADGAVLGARHAKSGSVSGGCDPVIPRLQVTSLHRQVAAWGHIALT